VHIIDMPGDALRISAPQPPPAYKLFGRNQSAGAPLGGSFGRDGCLCPLMITPAAACFAATGANDRLKPSEEARLSFKGLRGVGDESLMDF